MIEGGLDIRGVSEGVIEGAFERLFEDVFERYIMSLTLTYTQGHRPAILRSVRNKPTRRKIDLKIHLRAPHRSTVPTRPIVFEDGG